MHKVLSLKENISVNEGKVFQEFFKRSKNSQASSDYIVHSITVFTD